MIFLLLHCFPTQAPKWPKGGFVALRFICAFLYNMPREDIFIKEFVSNQNFIFRIVAIVLKEVDGP